MEIKCPTCGTENPSDSKYCKECAAILPSLEEISERTKTLVTAKEELSTGSTFANRYQIIEELGRGGMGRVYKAHDTEIGEKVAVKLIKSEIAADRKSIERFRNELKFARKIAHKNVGRMYDLGKAEETYYITMEFVDGQNLKGLIRQSGQLAIGTTVSIAKQICEGLSEAHRQGVIHRDLKPSNIMIDMVGNARVMDFGIARVLKTKGITGAGVMIGTPEYMPPEQVEGKEVDKRSDIYSLGVILYEMVTGRVPFEGDTPFTVGVKHKSEIPKNPRELNAQVPEDLNRLILRCLEKEKENRYQSANEVRSELENIEKGLPTTDRVIPKRKPLTSREITVTFGMKKILIPALVALVLVIIAIVIWQLLPHKEAIPPPLDKPSIAIMYFKNNTGDERLNHWRSALADLLITDLSQSKYITVLSGDRLFKILSDLNQQEAVSYSSDVLKEVASRGRVNHILQGNYTKAGDHFRINITLQAATSGELMDSERVEGKGEESFHIMVDELTKRIKANFRLSAEEIADDIDREVGKITTYSPEAYKYFGEGMRLYNKGEWRQSVSFFERAIELDSEFAMAYRALGNALGNLGYESRKYFQNALKFKNRISDREGYLIQAEFYRETEETWDKSIEEFKKLIQLYPDNEMGNRGLGLLYVNVDELDKAIERFKVNIQNKSESYHNYSAIAAAYRGKGMYDEAREVLEEYIKNFSDFATIHYFLAIGYLCQRRFDFAQFEIDKALSLNPNIFRFTYLKGDILMCKGDLANAEKEYQKLLEWEEKAANIHGIHKLARLYLLQGKLEKSRSQLKQGIKLAEELRQKDWTSNLHIKLAYNYLKSGNPKQGLEECNKAWSDAVEGKSPVLQRTALYWKTQNLLEMNSLDEAESTAQDLMEMIEKNINKNLIRHFYSLMGMIELKKNNLNKAIEYLKKAKSLLSHEYYLRFDGEDHADYFSPLALAYYKLDDIEKAQKEYEKITLLTAGRLIYGDIFAKSFYVLGKIYEQKGWKGKAIEHYEKFLKLWKDADPGISEVEDAKKRVAGLQKLP